MVKPHCFRCGRGLSQKYRINDEQKLLLAIFNKPSQVCQPCADILDKEIMRKAEEK